MLRRAALVRTDVSEERIISIIREAIEIEIRPYNMKTEGCFCLSKSWKLFMYSLKSFGRTPSPLGYVAPAPCS
jgi:hypothetical protein